MYKSKILLLSFILGGMLFPLVVIAQTPHQLVTGNQYTVTINVTNTGSVAISPLKIELDTLPAGISYIVSKTSERILPGETAHIPVKIELSLDALEGKQTLLFVLVDQAARRWQRPIEFNVISRIPDMTRMLPNYPNPFNPETWLPFELKDAADVSLKIYNLKGEQVRHLPLGFLPVGTYRHRSKAAHWDGTNHSGERVASGIYFCQFTAGNFQSIHRLAIMK